MLCIVNRIVNPEGLLEGLLREVFLEEAVVRGLLGIAVPAEV